MRPHLSSRYCLTLLPERPAVLRTQLLPDHVGNRRIVQQLEQKRPVLALDNGFGKGFSVSHWADSILNGAELRVYFTVEPRELGPELVHRIPQPGMKLVRHPFRHFSDIGARRERFPNRLLRSHEEQFVDSLVLRQLNLYACMRPNSGPV